MDNNQIWACEVLDKVAEKVKLTSKRIGPNFPHISYDGIYGFDPPYSWISGFWPGILWLLYRETYHESFKELAIACEDKLDEVLDGYEMLDHDMGFMWTLTAIAQYKITGSGQSKKRALKAASHLAGRFSPKGNFIQAWNQSGGEDVREVIIDTMMNLPLLYWASETTHEPRFRHIAQAHSDTVLKEFIREDGAVYHIRWFDSGTGLCVGGRGGQGFAEESAWSRGNAWAVYGMTLSYLHTNDQRYLFAAKKVVNFFLANLPEDLVPYWDFRLAALENEPRDSSAAAIVASALIELSKVVPAIEGRRYLESAVKILKSLYENYGAWNDKEEALLLHGTSSKPCKKGIDLPLIYGDYYFVEALTKLKGVNPLFY